QGDLEREEYLQASTSILQDALNQSQEVVGITRLDRNGNLAIQLGQSIPAQFWQLPPATSDSAIVSNPIELNGNTYLVVSAPILNPASQRVGTDLVLFTISSLQRIVEDYRGLGETGETIIGTVENGETRFFFPLRNSNAVPSVDLENAIAQAVAGETGVFQGENVASEDTAIALGAISESPWGIIVKMDRSELYASVNEQLLNLTTIVILLSLVGTGGMVLLLRPLAGQAMIHTDQLEKDVSEKQRLLAEKTTALELEQNRRVLVEQVLQQMDELNASSRQVAQASLATGSSAEEMLTLVDEGMKAVNDTVEGMNVLKENVIAIATQTESLNNSIHEIRTITTVVSQLANQTNMLALNAAVEAVRAGEQGKGFSVVASEIRKLADQSRVSADRIASLLSDIENLVEATTLVTNKGTQRVESTVTIAQETAIAFAGVRSAVNEVVARSQEISLSTQQQAAAIQQVVDATNAINSKMK
ncbi:MAG: methyl-accepting chemotaxis protein, partial [Chroococcales cyanobacterium]